MTTSMDLQSNVLYRWYLIPDFSESESKILWVANHAYIDGVSLFGLMNSLTVEKDFSVLGRVSPPSFGL